MAYRKYWWDVIQQFSWEGSSIIKQTMKFEVVPLTDFKNE
jgi:hypothetical protein